MAWHELGLLALMALAALATAAWISRRLVAPLEWMIDSRLDSPGSYDAPAAADDEPDFALHSLSAPAPPRRGV